MRVLVEASAAYNQGAGIGRYSRNILQRLIPMGIDDQFTLLQAPEDRSVSRFDASANANARFRTLPFNRRNADRLWFRLNVPVDARLFGGLADVVYSPDFTAPPAFGVPRMITVHDLAFLTYPEKTTDALRRYLEHVVPRQVAAADLVAVVSQATADNLMRHYDVPESKIVLARNAADEAFYAAKPLSEEERQRLDLPSRYFVMVGTIEPRKNHALALNAIERSGIGESTPLVIIGRPGWGHEKIMEHIRRLEHRGLVRHFDCIEDEALPGIVASAQAMVYPSWTEGFGLPVVEALATGIPVFTGTAPALKEVGGEHAIYVDPEDVDGLASLLMDFSDVSHSEASRITRSTWTRQFSWDSSTSTVYAALQELTRK